ncbi:SDR family NAD(P)-dependent oxidoreductase [Desulfobacula phenolica]|uniref:NAD(P)-dependent dehydrogenase, short-chain alcohol dehydrogenase family n=1 Tax=Desulfobacula phenolica TaxID=90732 RepID=A0A1H2JIV1_9BACT|nr:SDR family NAD(P)-dependent oxidoreductase [Desulfobacula phenolica]SDU56454.1 NAD(P)-dependent dehydrogenase, short-chain alcohol dehydrogenase family [Desulfobacula phenolica]
MIVLNESILVQKPIESVFNYTSEFSNIQNWDPGVVSSVKKSLGDVSAGTQYDLILKYGPFRPKMQYVVTEYEPFSRVVLKGKGTSYSATDTILFIQTPSGTRIDYQATIEFSGFANIIEPLLVPVIKRIGKIAIQGLEKTLNPDFNFPRKGKMFSSGSNIIDYIADHTILPGMMMFSKFGYAIGKRFRTKNTDILYGKRVVITGGTSGIGKAAAFEVARKNAFLTIIARNREKALKIQREIIEQTGNTHVDFLVADLSLMADIKRVSKQLAEKKKTIDILINNAGALFNERMETKEGFEKTFATDLLGVFYLTQNLIPVFCKSGGARIINVSSGGMYTQKIDVNDLQNKILPYDGSKAYARAKRGIVILTELWAKRLKNKKIVVHAMHPGWVDTPGIESSLPRFHSFTRSILRTPQQGADTIVWLACAKEPGLCSGWFWLDRRPRETVVFPWTLGSQIKDHTLWNKLEKLTRRF